MLDHPSISLTRGRAYPLILWVVASPMLGEGCDLEYFLIRAMSEWLCVVEFVIENIPIKFESI